MDIKLTDEQEDKIWQRIIDDIHKQPWQLTHGDDYREIALHQAGKLPNVSAQELLQNADKIYHWLLQEKAPLR